MMVGDMDPVSGRRMRQVDKHNPWKTPMKISEKVLEYRGQGISGLEGGRHPQCAGAEKGNNILCINLFCSSFLTMSLLLEYTVKQ